MGLGVSRNISAKGKVYLVGGGPGDPGLLTLKGKEVISKADVLVYDHLINPSILGYARGEAELIYVGKEAGSHTLSQDGINQTLIRKAGEGKTVVRLKGGDPFVFGRGGEELEELRRAGISYEVVPGVSSAIGVPAYAGIPLTHREYASTVAFITGHEGSEKSESSIKWDELSLGVDTLVFLMGINNAEFITEMLLRHGRPPHQPVAVIYKGTTPSQRTFLTRLKDLPKTIREEKIRPPGIIVVGEVARLREGLRWFEDLPLFSRRIVVTRAREQAGELGATLRSLGAEVLELPTIEIAPPDSWEGLDRALDATSSFDWLIFTSVNGVKAFFGRLSHKGLDTRALWRIKVASIGPKTAMALREHGIRPDLVPEAFVAEGLLEAFKRHGLSGKKVLIPRAQEAREVLVDGLMAMGAEVVVEPAYKTVTPGLNPRAVREIFSVPVDAITFTSSSTVQNFMGLMKGLGLPIGDLLKGATAACIGPVTSETAVKLGFQKIISPGSYTIEALVDAICETFKGSKNN